MTTAAGGEFSAIWAWHDAAAGYGLDLFDKPMSEFLLNIGEPGWTGDVDVTGHRLWQPLVAATLTCAENVWFDAHPGNGQDLVPAALHLATADAEAWLAVGRPRIWPPGHTFNLGTDDVMVLFDIGHAAQLGVAG